MWSIKRFTITSVLLIPCLWLQAQEHKLDQAFLPVSDDLLLHNEIQPKLDSISSLPDHYLTNIDSLLQTKAQLLQARINALQTKATDKLQGLDSLSNNRVGELVNDNLDKLTPEQYTTKLNDINGALEQYKSKITDTEELTWVEHYSGQLDQLDGVVTQYQDKLLNQEDNCPRNLAAILRKYKTLFQAVSLKTVP